MRLNHFKLTGTFILLHMFGTCLCTMTDNHYRLVSPATLVASQGFVSFSGLSRVRWFFKCTTYSACYYVSYDDAQGGCVLSSLNDGASISVDGWSLYRLDASGPDIGDYITVGSHSLAIKSQRATKTVAEDLCASSGSGRLVEIRTEQMFLDIVNYLHNMPQDMRDLYGDIWVAGELSGNNINSQTEA